MASGVFAQRDFVRLWIAQLVSALGGRITRTALPILAVLSVDSSPLALGLLAVLTVAPGVLVALVAGGMIDRSRKRPILVAADLVRAVAVASLPIAACAGALTMAHIYAVAAVVGAASALFQITDNAYIPALVGVEHVVQGNSVLEATEAVAEVAGPGLGGILIQILTAPIAVALDAASYLVSALFLGSIRKREEPAALEDAAPSVWRDIATGFRVSWEHPLVRPILLALTAVSFSGGFFAALYMLFALQVLGLDAATIGIVISMGGVGALLGALCSSALVRRLGLGRALITALTLSSLGALCIPAASGPLWLVLVLLFCHQLFGDGFMVAFGVQATSLRQTVLPLGVLARSNAAFQALCGAAVPLGAIAAGVLGELIGPREALWIGMGGGALAPLLLLPLRHLQRMPTAKAPIPRPAELELPPLTESELLAVLRSKMDEDAAADRFSGVALLARNGAVLYAEAYGLADRERNIPNTVGTRFRIGSMNKMFTATATMQLVQAGELGLDDPVGKHLTGYPNEDVATKVTTRHLLMHTGGTGDIFGPAFDAHRLELRSLQDYADLYGHRSPEFEPGSGQSYSNYGFILLGLLIEQVSGEDYYDYVRDHIYEPAGMTSTGSDAEDRAVVDRSVGYTRAGGDGRWRANADTLPYRGTSAGGGYSNVEDLLGFALALQRHALLDAVHTRMLTTGQVESPGGGYGFGFRVQTINGTRFLGSGGGAPGMNADLKICPELGYVIAVLSNIDPDAAGRISRFIADRLPRR